jgi:hypothetical protein
MGDSTSRIEPARGFGEPDDAPSRRAGKEKIRPRRISPQAIDDEWAGDDLGEADESENHKLDTTV